MLHLALLAAAYLLFVLQTCLAGALAFGAWTPHFLLLGAVTVALARPGASALLWAAILGFLSDCLARGGLGLDVLCFTGAVLLLQQLRDGTRLPGPLTFTLLVWLGVGLAYCASTGLRALLAGQWPPLGVLLGLSLGTASYTAFLAAGLFLAGKMFGRLIPGPWSARASDAAANRWRMLTD